MDITISLAVEFHAALEATGSLVDVVKVVAEKVGSIVKTIHAELD